ncbi:MAG: hypothetical protein WBK55_08330 [Alphaproteobacteria bacterium]
MMRYLFAAFALFSFIPPAHAASICTTADWADDITHVLDENARIWASLSCGTPDATLVSVSLGDLAEALGIEEASPSIILDLGDDGGNDSIALSEIAITGDTNSIFSEPANDKLRIAVGNDWPKADAADALAANGSNCSAGSAPLGVDASGAVESCTDYEEDLSNSAGLRAALSDESGTGADYFQGGDLGTPSAGVLTNATGTASGLTAGAATALAADPSNCSSGQAPLGVAASGAVQSCFDVWTEAENTSAAYITAAGNAATATALAANGSNCSAGSFPLGVNASGASESCTDAFTEAENTAAGYAPAASPIFTGIVTLPTAASPTTDADGEIAVDEDAFASGYNGLEIFNGTRSAYVVAVPAADTCTNGQVPKYTDGEFLCEDDDDTGGGGGTSITLDLGDDSGNDSAALSEIATTGDTNSIFTESSADKLRIAVGNDWPKADTADDLTCTDCIGATEIADSYLLNNGDVASGTYDYGGATLEIPNGNSLPGTCVVGDLFMDTDATTGQRLYACQSSNTWALQGDGGGGGGSSEVVFEIETGNFTVDASVPIYYFGDNSAAQTATFPAIGGDHDKWFYIANKTGSTDPIDVTPSGADSVLSVALGNVTEIAPGEVWLFVAGPFGANDAWFGTRLEGGSASTATALAANGGNCSSGSAPLGVDASGASESCFDVWTQAENTSAAYAPLASPIFTGIVTLPQAGSPTTDAVGEIAIDQNGWGIGYDAIEFYNNTSSAYVVATSVGDTPSNGQVPKFNTSGEITWEDDAGGATAWNAIGDADGAGTVVFGGHDQDITSSEEGGDILTITNTAADQGSDSIILRLATNDANDTNSIFVQGTNDEDGSPATDWRVKSTGTAGGLEQIWGATGVTVTTDGDGAVTFLSRGGGSGGVEDITFNLDDTSNQIDWTSSTGITEFDINTLDLNTDTIDFTGTGTMNGLDLLDSTSESTVEGQIDTLANLTSMQGQAFTFTAFGASIIDDANAAAGRATLGLRQEYCVAMSDQTSDLSTSPTQKAHLFLPAAATVNAVRAYVETAPTGSTIIVDLNEAGSTILSTRITIDASEFNGGSSTAQGTAAAAAVVSDTSIAANAKITFDLDQRGSTIPGKGLVACIDVSF